MPRKVRRKNGRRRGRRPALTDQQKKQIRKIAHEEIEKAFRQMLASIGIERGRRNL
jgi:hypothetical protein